jgi:hypothetical protein
MGGWIDELAEAFGQASLSAEESERLLRAAREVAHRVERRMTPLAAFLVGLDVAAREAAGEPRDAALDASIGTVERLLPAPDGG